MRPDIRYARNGEVNLAYKVVGDGPIDLVYVAGALTNLELAWEQPGYRRFCERLATFARVILFDKRGMGLSDRVRFATLEERMDDVRAVMEAVGSTEAALLGESEGGPLSLLFAATHPERTRALVLAGAEVKEETTEDWPWGESTREDFEEAMDLDRVTERWGQGGAVDWFAPSRADEMRDWYGRVQLQSATPSDAIAFMRMAFEIDVREVVPTISVPALVLHRTDDRVCHVENGRWLARTLRDARYVELPGVDHALWVDGGDQVVPEIQEFLTGIREPIEPDRVLATVLFTDIVGSTERAGELGDSRWRDLLERHHALIRADLQRFRGAEIDTAGDGFFATFDGPARGIRCACSIVANLRTVGLEIRAGLHTGELELAGDAVRGIAVHTGARVASHAGAGEVLVSQTVKDLVAGSGIELEDRGAHELKGIPGEWRLYAVAQS